MSNFTLEVRCTPGGVQITRPNGDTSECTARFRLRYYSSNEHPHPPSELYLQYLDENGEIIDRKRLEADGGDPVEQVAERHSGLLHEPDAFLRGMVP